jgi:hypothetical protein
VLSKHLCEHMLYHLYKERNRVYHGVSGVKSEGGASMSMRICTLSTHGSGVFL